MLDPSSFDGSNNVTLASIDGPFGDFEKPLDERAVSNESDP